VPNEVRLEKKMVVDGLRKGFRLIPLSGKGGKTNSGNEEKHQGGDQKKTWDIIYTNQKNQGAGVTVRAGQSQRKNQKRWEKKERARNPILRVKTNPWETIAIGQGENSWWGEGPKTEKGLSPGSKGKKAGNISRGNDRLKMGPPEGKLGKKSWRKLHF